MTHQGVIWILVSGWDLVLLSLQPPAGLSYLPCQFECHLYATADANVTITKEYIVFTHLLMDSHKQHSINVGLTYCCFSKQLPCHLQWQCLSSWLVSHTIWFQNKTLHENCVCHLQRKLSKSELLISDNRPFVHWKHNLVPL